MINSTLSDQVDPVGKAYPKLMINSSDTVIIAKDQSNYTVLAHSSSGQIGSITTDGNVITSGYIDYTGPLTLENA